MGGQVKQSLTKELVGVLVTVRRGIAKAMEMDRCHSGPLGPSSVATPPVAEAGTGAAQRHYRRGRKGKALRRQAGDLSPTRSEGSVL